MEDQRHNAQRHGHQLRSGENSEENATLRITTLVKARMAESKAVSATSISVETLNGVVMLSGFAKSTTEKDTAEGIARGVKNVKSVRNEIAVRP